MQVPAQLQKKYLQRFDELIEEGQAIHKAIQEVPGRVYRDYEGYQRQHSSSYRVDWQSFVAWRTKSVTLLNQVIGTNGAHRGSLEGFSQISNDKSKLEWGVSVLKGLKDDFEKGFLSDLALSIESEISSDYMGQAEQLLVEGQSGKSDHVPAAVLSGAVLEKALRTICSNQNPVIAVITPKGEPKTLNPLIDDLKKAGVFNEAKAKQLRAWAAIRNHAAHGEIDQFKRSDVEQMIAGINSFLADFLKNS